MDRFAHLLREMCEKANILQKYLNERWVEVMGYYEDLFSQEEANRHMRKNAREEGLAEGRKEGRIEGREEERTEIATKLLAEGMEPEKVAELTGLSIEKTRALMGSQTS